MLLLINLISKYRQSNTNHVSCVQYKKTKILGSDVLYFTIVITIQISARFTALGYGENNSDNLVKYIYKSILHLSRFINFSPNSLDWKNKPKYFSHNMRLKIIYYSRLITRSI